MKFQQHEAHLRMFEQQFIIDQPHDPIRNTQENFIENNSQFILMHNLAPPNNIGSNIGSSKFKTNATAHPAPKPELETGRENRKKYKFLIEYLIFEILAAYGLVVAFMKLNTLIYFPFFEALFIFVMSVSTQPIDTTTTLLLILLGIPTAVANYNLNVWILTYPEIIIYYFSCYLFTKKRIISYLWIVNSLLFLLFGFILLPYLALLFTTQYRFTLYYLFPWLLVIVKLITGLIGHVIFHSNFLLSQISLFLYGLAYGFILTLQISSIEFWYLLVLLTLDIINTRYQFLLSILKRILKLQHKPASILEATVSGYNAVNSFHLIGFIYILFVLSLNSANFAFQLEKYFRPLHKPAVVWVFFLAYEIISLIRLRRHENLLIVGYVSNSYVQVGIRGAGLALGLWFFYLGLGIPSKIFAT